jgi:hypothetical protein
MSTSNFISDDDGGIFATLDNTPIPPAPTKPVNVPFDLELPTDAMYGYLGDVARSTDAPLSFAYPDALAIFAGLGINMDESNRESTGLYVGILGKSGIGKSTTRDRVVETLGIPDDKLYVVSPGSDQGLIMLFTPPKPTNKNETVDDSRKSGVIIANEMRVMFQKMAIKGSSLDATLCDVWDGGKAGVAVRNSRAQMNAFVSIVGNLPAEEPSDLRQMLTANSRFGFYNRLILCPAPPKWNWDFTWKATIGPRYPVDVTVPAHIHRLVREWGDALPEDFDRAHYARTAVRIAIISSSANHEKQVSHTCMAAALKFIEWQIKVKQEYTASLAEDESAQRTQIVTDKIIKYTKGTDKWFRWSAFTRDTSLSQRFDADYMKRIKYALTDNGFLDAEMDTSGGRPQPTGMYRLVTDKVLAEKAEDRRAREMQKEEDEHAKEERAARFTKKTKGQPSDAVKDALARHAAKTQPQTQEAA